MSKSNLIKQINKEKAKLEELKAKYIESIRDNGPMDEQTIALEKEYNEQKDKVNKLKKDRRNTKNDKSNLGDLETASEGQTDDEEETDEEETDENDLVKRAKKLKKKIDDKNDRDKARQELIHGEPKDEVVEIAKVKSKIGFFRKNYLLAKGWFYGLEELTDEERKDYEVILAKTKKKAKGTFNVLDKITNFTTRFMAKCLKIDKDSDEYGSLKIISWGCTIAIIVGVCSSILSPFIFIIEYIVKIIKITLGGPLAMFIMRVFIVVLLIMLALYGFVCISSFFSTTSSVFQKKMKEIRDNNSKTTRNNSSNNRRNNNSSDNRRSNNSSSNKNRRDNSKDKVSKPKVIIFDDTKDGRFSVKQQMEEIKVVEENTEQQVEEQQVEEQQVEEQQVEEQQVEEQQVEEQQVEEVKETEAEQTENL